MYDMCILEENNHLIIYNTHYVYAAKCISFIVGGLDVCVSWGKVIRLSVWNLCVSEKKGNYLNVGGIWHITCIRVKRESPKERDFWYVYIREKRESPKKGVFDIFVPRRKGNLLKQTFDMCVSGRKGNLQKKTFDMCVSGRKWNNLLKGGSLICLYQGERGIS